MRNSDLHEFNLKAQATKVVQGKLSCSDAWRSFLEATSGLAATQEAARRRIGLYEERDAPALDYHCRVNAEGRTPDSGLRSVRSVNGIQRNERAVCIVKRGVEQIHVSESRSSRKVQ